ncbi:MAG: hypothetical protein VX000_04840, partial [Myxococcota bacterium]|nr:hypothetical protein [Myxococcota bacterium]
GAIGVGLTPEAAAAVPDDVDLFRKMVQKSEEGGLLSAGLRESVAALLVDETLVLVDEIARARDYPSWFSSQNPMVAREVRRQVGDAVEASGGKADDLYNLGTRVFSGAFAETAMASAAGVAPPALPGGSGQRSLDQSASVVTPSGPLKLQARKSYLSGDRGTTGHGNGRLDPGEVAQVTLVLVNISKRRLYSTSLYLESASDR